MVQLGAQWGTRPPAEICARATVVHGSRTGWLPRLRPPRASATRVRQGKVMHMYVPRGAMYMRHVSVTCIICMGPVRVAARPTQHEGASAAHTALLG